MKITRKVLSVLMAMIIMAAAFPIGSLHTVAADKPTLRLEAPKMIDCESDGETIEVKAYLDNANGFLSGLFLLEWDPDIFEYTGHSSDIPGPQIITGISGDGSQYLFSTQAEKPTTESTIMLANFSFRIIAKSKEITDIKISEYDGTIEGTERPDDIVVTISVNPTVTEPISGRESETKYVEVDADISIDEINNTGVVSIVETNIAADTVFNSNGFGSLRTLYRYDEETQENWPFPQSALVDKSGNILFPYTNTMMRYYYNEGVVSLVGGAYTECYDDFSTITKCKFYNLNGQEIFENDFFGAFPMVDGYAHITEAEWRNTENDWAEPVFHSYLINSEGDKVYTFPEEYNNFFDPHGWDYEMSYYSSCMASRYEDGLILCWTQQPDSYQYSDGVAITPQGEAEQESTMFYIDIEGKNVLTLDKKYSNATVFTNGYAVVTEKESEKSGYIDKSGNEIIPCIYDSAGSFNDDLAAVCKDGKWGYINSRNETIIPFEYDAAYGAASGLAVVGIGNKFGLIDYSNSVIIPFVFDDISTYSNEIAYAIKNQKLYLISDFKPADMQEDNNTELPEQATTATPTTTEAPTDPVPAKALESSDPEKAVVNADKKQVTVLPGRTVDELKDLLGGGVTIVDAEGSVIDSGAKVGTGAIIKTADGAEFTVVVPGDTDGDGKVGAADARKALRASAKIEPLSGAYEKAADIGGDAKVKAADARTILRIAAKLDKITKDVLAAV